MSVLAGLTSALAIAGVLLVVVGAVPRAPATAPSPSGSGVASRLRTPLAGTTAQRRRRAGLVAAALAAGGVGWAVTGWPVAALGAAAATVGLPWLAHHGRATGRIERLEALESWTRRLADLLLVGSGIEQALVASVRSTPVPIAGEVRVLAARLQARTPTESALRAFADDLDDPAADLVASALILASRRRGRGLAQVLDGLACAVADEVTVRRTIQADRAKPTTTARAVTWIALLAAAALIVLDRAYVAPFGTAAGQLVLAAVLVIFGGAFVWMRGLATISTEHRFLVDTRPASRSTWGDR